MRHISFSLIRLFLSSVNVAVNTFIYTLLLEVYAGIANKFMQVLVQRVCKLKKIMPVLGSNVSTCIPTNSVVKCS